jgi:hypothetical protein
MKLLIGFVLGVAATYGAALALFMIGDRLEVEAAREDELEGWANGV